MASVTSQAGAMAIHSMESAASRAGAHAATEATESAIGAAARSGGKGVMGFLPMLGPLFGLKMRLDDGMSKPKALAITAAEEVAYAVAPWPMMAAQMTPAVIAGMASAGQAKGQVQSKMYQANFGGNYVDTEQAYTMRQRGLQAIQKTGMNTRSILGSEARRGR